MNHKLQNTILASAVVGTALLFGLLAAEPLGDSRASDRHAFHAFHPSTQAAGKRLAMDLRQDLGRDMEARARAFEAELVAGPSGEVLALASALVATSMVEATLASVLEDIDTSSRQAPARPAPAGRRDAAPARNRGRLATPYFSTAQGLRRGSRE